MKVAIRKRTKTASRKALSSSLSSYTTLKDSEFAEMAWRPVSREWLLSSWFKRSQLKRQHSVCSRMEPTMTIATQAYSWLESVLIILLSRQCKLYLPLNYSTALALQVATTITRPAKSTFHRIHESLLRRSNESAWWISNTMITFILWIKQSLDRQHGATNIRITRKSSISSRCFSSWLKNASPSLNHLSSANTWLKQTTPSRFGLKSRRSS